MKLIPTEDIPGLYNRLVSEDGTIEMGIYPVMFGFRVRAGRVDREKGFALTYDVDWCGGADEAQVQMLYAICRTILEKRNPQNAFDGIPGASKIKPFFKDSDFVDTVTKISGPIGSLPSITKQDLAEIKGKFLQETFYKEE